MKAMPTQAKALAAGCDHTHDQRGGVVQRLGWQAEHARGVNLQRKGVSTNEGNLWASNKDVSNSRARQRRRDAASNTRPRPPEDGQWVHLRHIFGRMDATCL